ncbi:uncharacterized protein MKK02DRAFT_39820 [Dioszegia hungarica]|uniref:Uncharacterized protein n=1 Tax=Dioszegia hungarica TaxID=4972 RepID=A0AA38HHE7_9TREE|nr:uncharacterized protein MKK02DRAFT_39820 [Dioszegia hungarica]KAI9639514.1 hypothetical protein MKK02DRAFT_39820 [Dioszegia hungarica]
MPPPASRRTSHGANHAVHHAHHAHGHGHTVKRRQGSSTHLHSGHHGAVAHAAPHAGPSRRSSEGEHGRRAVAAGLTMASMEPGKAKRKTSGDRPVKKANRSDTSLSTLSRVNSRHSNSSNSRNNSRHSSRNPSPTRPAANTRQRSDPSVQLDEAGNPTAEVDSGEEGWEDEGKKPRSDTPKADMGDLRRTKSDSHAPPEPKATDSGAPRPPVPTTRKTTGFAGPTQTPDPLVGVYSHALNDPTHIMPAHQIKHQQSARSLHAIQVQNGETEARTPGLGRRSDGARRSMPGMSRTSSTASMRRTESPGVLAEVKRVESGLSMTKTAGDTPPAARGPADSAETERPNDPSDVRVGAEPAARLSTSPSYPFPKVASAVTEEPLSESPSNMITETPPPIHEHIDEPPRSRQISTASSQAPRTLRHRYSNSSIRSIQSLRAPPHPLNSPTGYRTGIHPSASTQTSPRRGKGLSMHHPPIAPPVVSSDVASGMKWTVNGLPEEAEEQIRRSPAAGTRRARVAEPSTAAPAAPSISGRTSSFSSVRSVATLLGSTSIHSTAPSSPARPGADRRPTALQATARAARLRSTADPAAYHASLGLSPATADTAHLISRFLPPPKTERPSWEISPEAIQAGHVGIGLTNGDYRESHEALMRTMMTMGVKETAGAAAGGRVASSASRMGDVGSGAITPRQAGMSISSMDDIVGVGMVKVNGAKGGMLVARGGWEGRSPFLLSVDRCLAQKPVRGVPGI